MQVKNRSHDCQRSNEWLKSSVFSRRLKAISDVDTSPKLQTTSDSDSSRPWVLSWSVSGWSLLVRGTSVVGSRAPVGRVLSALPRCAEHHSAHPRPCEIVCHNTYTHGLITSRLNAPFQHVINSEVEFLVFFSQHQYNTQITWGEIWHGRHSLALQCYISP